MFVLRQILTQLARPMPFSMLLITAGLLLVFSARGRTIYRRAGLALGVFGIVLLYLLSVPWISRPLIRPLEHRYPPLVSEHKIPPDPLIIILGSGMKYGNVPATARLSDAGLARTVEAVRIAGLAEQPLMLPTGGVIWARSPIAQAAADAMLLLGVPPDAVMVLPEGRTTGEEAAAVATLLQQRPKLGARPIILVTSASHMPRAVQLFEAHLGKVLPAPADYHSLSSGGFSPNDLFPSASSLRTSERAIHEYLGQVAAGLKLN